MSDFYSKAAQQQFNGDPVLWQNMQRDLAIQEMQVLQNIQAQQQLNAQQGPGVAPNFSRQGIKEFLIGCAVLLAAGLFVKFVLGWG